MKKREKKSVFPWQRKNHLFSKNPKRKKKKERKKKTRHYFTPSFTSPISSPLSLPSQVTYSLLSPSLLHFFSIFSPFFLHFSSFFSSFFSFIFFYHMFLTRHLYLVSFLSLSLFRHCLHPPPLRKPTHIMRGERDPPFPDSNSERKKKKTHQK